MLKSTSTVSEERGKLETTTPTLIGGELQFAEALFRKLKGNPILDLRLVEIRHGRSWYRYLTSVLDPKILPPFVVGALYSRRWRIEESFLLLKRLPGLSYLWTGEPLRWAGSPT